MLGLKIKFYSNLSPQYFKNFTRFSRVKPVIYLLWAVPIITGSSSHTRINPTATHLHHHSHRLTAATTTPCLPTHLRPARIFSTKNTNWISHLKCSIIQTRLSTACNLSIWFSITSARQRQWHKLRPVMSCLCQLAQPI